MSKAKEPVTPASGQEHQADDLLERYYERRLAEIRGGMRSDEGFIPLDRLKARVDERAHRHQRPG
jgi:hypothetical protein